MLRHIIRYVCRQMADRRRSASFARGAKKPLYAGAKIMADRPPVQKNNISKKYSCNRKKACLYFNK